MITVQEHCKEKAFTIIELDGVVCYIRLFMEAILRKSHKKVNISVFIKDRSDALIKNTNGFTFRKSSGEFVVVIFTDTHKRMLTTLSHELIHVKQMLENGFKIDQPENSIFWEDKFFMPLSALVRLLKEKQEEIYRRLPWEFEAELQLPAVLEIVTSKFEALLNNDYIMKKYLDKALTDSSYKAIPVK